MSNNATPSPYKIIGPSVSLDGLHVYQTTNPATLEGLWRAFEESGHCTLYQTYGWCEAWLKTVGQASGAKPVVIVGLCQFGTPVFLLPLQLRRVMGLGVLEWLGSSNNGYGYGILARDFVRTAASGWFAANWHHILASIQGVDAVNLRNIPSAMFGHRGVLLSVTNIVAADASHALDFRGTVEELIHEKRGNAARRSMRKREDRLAAMGDVNFTALAGPDLLRAALADVLADQQARLKNIGIHQPFSDVERRFIHALADAHWGQKPLLRLSQLHIGGERALSVLGGVCDGTYWALISAMVPGRFLKHSPGEIGLRRLFESCVAENLQTFDFSAGDSSYKSTWSDRIIERRHSIAARRLGAVPLVLAMLAAEAAKREIKSRPVVFAAFKAVRTLLGNVRSKLFPAAG